MLKKLFGKKDTQEALVAPITGKVQGLEEVPDPTFAQKMMGDGIAIMPVDGKVVSPVKGKVVQIFPTKHAVGIESKNGVEILIHIGLETVELAGEGFESHVEAGQSVNPGDVLVTFDKELVGEKAKSLITPVIITNGDNLGELQKIEQGTDVTAGETKVLECQLK